MAEVFSFLLSSQSRKCPVVPNNIRKTCIIWYMCLNVAMAMWFAINTKRIHKTLLVPFCFWFAANVEPNIAKIQCFQFICNNTQSLVKLKLYTFCITKTHLLFVKFFVFSIYQGEKHAIIQVWSGEINEDFFITAAKVNVTWQMNLTWQESKNYFLRLKHVWQSNGWQIPLAV